MENQQCSLLLCICTSVLFYSTLLPHGVNASDAGGVLDPDGNGLEPHSDYYHGFYSRLFNSVPETITVVFREKEEKRPRWREYMRWDRAIPLVFYSSRPLPKTISVRVSYAANRSLDVDVYQGNNWIYDFSGDRKGMVVASFTLEGNDEMTKDHALLSHRIEASLSADGCLVINRTWEYVRVLPLQQTRNEGEVLESLQHIPQALPPNLQTPVPPPVPVQQPAVQVYPAGTQQVQAQVLRPFLQEHSLRQAQSTIKAHVFGQASSAISVAHQLSNIDSFAKLSNNSQSSASSTTSGESTEAARARYRGLYSSRRKSLPYSLGINYGTEGSKYYKLIDVTSSSYSDKLPLSSGPPMVGEFKRGVPMAMDNPYNISETTKSRRYLSETHSFENWTLPPNKSKSGQLSVSIYQGESMNTSANYYLGDCVLTLARLVDAHGTYSSDVSPAKRLIQISMKVNETGVLTVDLKAAKVKKKEAQAAMTTKKCNFQLMSIDIPLTDKEEVHELEAENTIHRPQIEVINMEEHLQRVSPNISSSSDGTVMMANSKTSLSTRIDQLDGMIGTNRLITCLLVISVITLVGHSIHLSIGFKAMAAKNGGDVLPVAAGPASTTGCRYKSSPNGEMAELSFTNPGWHESSIR